MAKRRLVSCSIACALIPSAAWAVRVAPGEDIQAAVDQACAAEPGAERVVHLAAGVHELTGSVFITCGGLTFHGDGSDETRITWVGGDHPALTCPVTPPFPEAGVPVLIISPPNSVLRITDPCTIPEDFPALLEAVTVRDLAVIRPSPPAPGTIPTTGIAVLWTRGNRIARVAISGFPVGIDHQSSDDWTVEESRVAAPQACVRSGTFGGLALTVKPNQLGGLARGNELECMNGVNLTNTLGATVVHNRIRARQFAVLTPGAGEHLIAHNVARRIPGGTGLTAFLTASQTSGLNVHHNVVCDFDTGIRFTGFMTNAAVIQWTAPSDDNLVHHNQLFGAASGQDHVVLDPGFIGDNRFFDNQLAAADGCPAE